MRKLKEGENLIKEKWYLVKGKSFSKKPFRQKRWIIEVLDVKIEGGRTSIVEEETYLGDETRKHNFQFSGKNEFLYENVLNEGAIFFELTPKEVEEWKLKMTESRI